MRNMIAYKGEVTLKILHGDKVVKTIKQHNEGMPLLMKYLTHCLGSDLDLMKAPKYIRLYYSSIVGEMPGNLSENEITLRPVITTYSPTYPDTYEGTKEGVLLTFLVPYSVLSLSSRNPVNRIAIYDTTNKDDGLQENYMAWIALPEAINLTSGESLMIIWEMTLENVVINE